MRDFGLRRATHQQNQNVGSSLKNAENKGVNKVFGPGVDMTAHRAGGVSPGTAIGNGTDDLL